MRMHKYWKIFGLVSVVVVLAVVFVALYEFFRAEQTPDQPNLPMAVSNNQKNTVPAEKPETDCASNVQSVFTHPFADLRKIRALGTLGGATGGSPGRSYVSIKKGEKVPVYNPADAILETIVWADRGGGHPEYGFYFQASCEVTFLLDHVDEIADGIRDLAPRKPASSTQTQLGSQSHMRLKAGELLGYTDGTAQAQTFDFLLINQAKPAYHINPARWTWAQAIYADCPYDYFTEDLKRQHYALLGNPTESSLMPSEKCGSPSQDIAGTLSGGWFQGDSTTEKGKWVMFGQQFNSA